MPSSSIVMHLAAREAADYGRLIRHQQEDGVFKGNRNVIRCNRRNCDGYSKNRVTVETRYVAASEQAAVANLAQEQEVTGLANHSPNCKAMLLKRGAAVGLLVATRAAEHAVHLIDVGDEPRRMEVHSLRSLDPLSGRQVFEMLTGLSACPPSKQMIAVARDLPDYDPDEVGYSRAWVVGGLGVRQIPFICVTICEIDAAKARHNTVLGYQLTRHDEKRLPTLWRRESVRAFRESPLGGMYFYSCTDESEPTTKRPRTARGCRAVCADEYFEELV
jgi:hypothetical protein